MSNNLTLFETIETKRAMCCLRAEKNLMKLKRLIKLTVNLLLSKEWH